MARKPNPFAFEPVARRFESAEDKEQSETKLGKLAKSKPVKSA